jgi:hypothetical protein
MGKVNMQFGLLSEKLAGLQQDLQRLESLIPDAVKFVQKPSEKPVEIAPRKVIKFEKRFSHCYVSSDLKINFFKSSDQQLQLEVDFFRSKITYEEIDEVKLKTAVVENIPLYKCTIILQNRNKVRFRSSSHEKINLFFKWLQPPIPCKVMELRKRRLAYAVGNQQSLGRDFSVLLKSKFAIELLAEEPDGKIGKGHVLFYVYQGSPSRQPQQPDLDSWIREANKRSGGHGVYLLVEWGQNIMDARRMNESGIFMNDPEKRKPVVLRILREQERGLNDLEKLAEEVAKLIDQVSGTGLEKEAI